jgi:hypothetical protein
VSLNRVVALKMILAGQLAMPQDVQRFHRQAAASALVIHSPACDGGSLLRVTVRTGAPPVLSNW